MRSEYWSVIFRHHVAVFDGPGRANDERRTDKVPNPKKKDNNSVICGQHVERVTSPRPDDTND